MILERHPTPRLRAYLILGAAGFFAAAAFGRAELILLVAPLFIAALAGIAFVQPPQLTLEATLAHERLVEGETTRLAVRLAAASPVRWLEVAIVLPPGLGASGPVIATNLRLEPGTPREVVETISGRRWGNHAIGTIAVRARDALGFFAFEGSIDPGLRLRVFPRPAALRRLIRPAQTLASFGNQTSRRSGEGIEFSNVRPYSPGDAVRSVNWRLSARRHELYVNELHPETTTQVVLLLDTFTEVLDADQRSSLAMGVRAAHGVADYYLRQRDRVGLITFGASIQWLTPSMGQRQSYRIVDVLLDASARQSAVWKGVEIVPPRSLPAKALVIALSPLVDKRTTEALFNLRARGFDLAVIEIRPQADPDRGRDPVAALSGRIWELERDMLRERFRRVGVAIATWRFDAPLAAAVEEIRAFRRHGRLLSA